MTRDVWEAKYPDRFFDVVTLWHSLEHMTDPARVIREIQRILKNDGILIVAVPNWNSWERKMFGTHWFHLDVPRHQYHFSQRTLIKFLDTHGFLTQRVQWIAPEYDFYSVTQSFLNVLFPDEPNALYTFLNGGKRVGLKHTISFAVLLPISVLFVLMMWLWKSSGTVEVTARKIQTTRHGHWET